MGRAGRERAGIPKWNTLVFLALVALLPLTTLLYGAVHPISIAFTYAVIGIVATIAFGARLLGSEYSLSSDGMSLSLLLVAIYCVVQVVPFGTIVVPEAGVSIGRTISVDVFWTSVSAVHFFIMGVFLLLMNSLLPFGARLKRFATLFVVAAIAYAFFAILQFIISPGKIYGVYEVVGASPFGSFVNRHNFAAIMEMAIALPLAFVLSGTLEKDRRFLFMVVTGALGTALLMSGSRGGLVALAAMVVLMLLLVQRGKVRTRRSLPRQLALVAVLVAGLIGGMVFIGGDNTLTRVADTASTGDFSTNRIAIWRVTGDVIREHMPFGAGFGAFRTAYTPHDPTSGLQRVEQAHNDYLQVIADGGLPGVAIGVFFLVMLMMTARRALEVKDRVLRTLAMGISCGVFAVLVHSLFDFVLHTTAVALIFLSQLAMLSVIARISLSEAAVEDDPEPAAVIAEFNQRQD
jgi:O-antigen ligase